MAEDAPAASGIAGLDMEALGKMLDEKLNIIVGKRLNRDSLGKLLEEKLEAKFGGDSLGKAVEAAIAKMVEETPAEPVSNGATAPTGTPAGKGNGAAATPQDDPRIAQALGAIEQLNKQLAAEKKARADAEKAAQATAAAARESAILAHTRAQLAQQLGGNDQLAGILAKELVRDRKWVDQAQDGSFVWNIQEQDSLGQPTTRALPFAEGLKAWVASDEGKRIVPARSTQVGMPSLGMPFAAPQAFGQPPQQQQPAHGYPGPVPVTNPFQQMGVELAKEHPEAGAALFHATAPRK